MKMLARTDRTAVHASLALTVLVSFVAVAGGGFVDARRRNRDDDRLFSLLTVDAATTHTTCDPTSKGVGSALCRRVCFSLPDHLVVPACRTTT